MSDHPIQGLMTCRDGKFKRRMVDVNTIIGDPVETPDGRTILTGPRLGLDLQPVEAKFIIQKSNTGQSVRQNNHLVVVVGEEFRLLQLPL